MGTLNIINESEVKQLLQTLRHEASGCSLGSKKIKRFKEIKHTEFYSF